MSPISDACHITDIGIVEEAAFEEERTIFGTQNIAVMQIIFDHPPEPRKAVCWTCEDVIKHYHGKDVKNGD